METIVKPLNGTNDVYVIFIPRTMISPRNRPNSPSVRRYATVECQTYGILRHNMWGGNLGSKRRKVYETGERDHLEHKPFAGLEPPSQADVAPPPRDADRPTQSFTVSRTRKGGWPVRLEKRKGGKVVTVLEGIEGDATAALTALKRRCGAGGTLREDKLELQGDHQDTVTAYLELR